MHLSSTIPALPVSDMASAVTFYADRFGFRALHHGVAFAVVARDEAVLHLWAADDTGWRLRDTADLTERPVRTGAEDFLAGTASCRIHVDEVDALHAELSASGVLHPTDTGEPVDTDHHTREFHTLDLDGNLLTFYRRG